MSEMPRETFAAFFYRTRGRCWENVVVPDFADGLVAYVEEAVGRFEAAERECRGQPRSGSNETTSDVSQHYGPVRDQPPVQAPEQQ